MGIKNTALEMNSLVDIFNLEKNIFPPVCGPKCRFDPWKFYDIFSFL